MMASEFQLSAMVSMRIHPKIAYLTFMKQWWLKEHQEVFGAPLFAKLSVPEGTISNCLRPKAEF
jgi:hypothetical protein